MKQVKTPAPAKCDECGSDSRTITRRDRGRRFCVNCYQREFKRQLCPKCGNYARILRNDSTATCKACESSGPCSRCGRENRPVGKLTAYGAICNVCAGKFADTFSCAACGNESRAVHRSTGEHLKPNDKLCRKCAQKSFRTCIHCRRYRDCELDNDERPICSVCLTNQDKPCNTCGELMPAGYGNQCESCYWVRTANKRKELNSEAISNSRIRGYFNQYCLWLIETIGAKKTALRLNKDIAFFLFLQSQWAEVPDYQSLLEHHGAEGLRRLRLPIQWLDKANLISVDEQLRERFSEQSRIHNLLSTLDEESASYKMQKGYYDSLNSKNLAGNLSLRTVRLLLSPATSLLRICAPNLPSQTDLERYLENSPGQRNSLSGFIKHLNSRSSVALTMPKVIRHQVQKNREKRIEHEMAALAHSNMSMAELENAWIPLALGYFHSVSKNESRRIIAHGKLTDAPGGLNLCDGECVRFIPKMPNSVIPLRLLSHELNSE